MIAKRIWATFHRHFLRKPLRLPAAPIVIAAIPLISKERAGDWETVSANLALTVSSVLDQTYDKLEVIVCGQDEPLGVQWTDRVRFLKAPPMDTRKKTDKDQKIRLMAEDMARRHHGVIYAMILDADDLLHPGLFAHVAEDNNGRGYLIDKGYLFDLNAKDFAPLTPNTGHSFDKHCGSCAIFALDFERPWVAKRFLNTLSRGHNKYDELTKRFGSPLDPVPFHAALYVINHGENARARRGSGGFKVKLLTDNRISNETDRTKIWSEFGLDRVLSKSG